MSSQARDSSVINQDICLHTKIAKFSGQSYCDDCGEALMSFCREETTFFEDASTIISNDRKLPKSIRKELEKFPLSMDIKERADRIYTYKVGNNTYRANVRKEIKFTCIYEAFKEANIYKNPTDIAEMLGINRKGMARGVYRCSFLCTGKNEPSKVSITAMHLVPDMLTKNGIDYDASHIEDIARIYEYAKERSELLNRSKPQSCAAGLVYFYLRKKDNSSNSSKINKVEIAKSCGVSTMTLGKVDTELEIILGSKISD